MSEQRLNRDVWIKVAIGTIVAVVVNVSVGFLESYVATFYVFLTSFLSQFWINLIGIFAIALVGIGLYLVRERWRVYYGVIEVAFALAYGWYSISKVTTVGYVESLSVIAAIYLVVRGIDNIMVGRRAVTKVAETQSGDDTVTI